jgi:thiamine biosynthesis lipoprotein
VIDPRTGSPACGLLSVTVICDRAAQADALSTGFFIGGIEAAASYCAAHARTMAILVPDDGTDEALLYGTHPCATLEAAA